MKTHYAFSTTTKNPYAKRWKRSMTIRLDESTVAYSKELATETQLPYQSVINWYLRDCAARGRRLSLSWRPVRARAVQRCALQVVWQFATLAIDRRTRTRSCRGVSSCVCPLTYVPWRILTK